MNNEEVIADLKQFIAATVSQATAGMAMKADLSDLATKADLNDFQAAITQALMTNNEMLDYQLADLEQRMLRLEQRVLRRKHPRAA